MIQFGKQYYQGPSATIAHQIYQVHRICPQCNPGKLIYANIGPLPLPTEYLKYGNLILSNSHLLKICICLNCVFSVGGSLSLLSGHSYGHT